MSYYLITEKTMVGIGDAIRNKEGSTDKIVIRTMPERIAGLSAHAARTIPDGVYLDGEKIGDSGIIDINGEYHEDGHLFEDGTWQDGELCEPCDYCLTFTSPEDFSIAMSNVGTYNNGTLEYSIDNITWNTWDGSAISASANNNIYLRGNNNSHFATDYYIYCQFDLMGSNISCSGNIETLLDWQTVKNGEHPTMDSYCYFGIFYECTSLTSAPELPATTLASRCYDQMFYGCTSLTTAPALPATTLADYWYDQMLY